MATNKHIKGQTPSSASVPVQSVPLNDDTWSAYLFTAFVDDDQENQYNIQGLCDQIASGSRQRFKLIQRADVISWALENVRFYDACKELKAILDSNVPDSALPEAAVSKVLKLRLLALRQDGLELMNSAKAPKDAVESVSPAVPDASDASKSGKAAKKDDKEKEKDRAKSSPKKPVKGGTTKAPESPSRPDSAQGQADVSKRKAKLRDRGAKPDAKLVIIGDEPEDGPDAYYMLRGFSPSALNSLMEENDLQLNAVFRIGRNAFQNVSEESLLLGYNDLAKSNLLSVNPNFAAARKYSLSQSEGLYWKTIAWANIQAETTTDSKELYDILAKKIYSLLNLQKAYENFYAKDTVVTIPTIEDATSVKNELRFLLNSLPIDKSINSELLLGALLEYSVRKTASAETEEGDIQPEVPTSVSDEISFLVNYLEKCTKKLAIGNDDKEKSINKVMTGSTSSLEIASMGLKSKDIIASVISTLSVFVNPVSFASATDIGRESYERLLNDGELRRLCGLNVNETRRAFMQFDFEEMLGSDGVTLALDSWSWAEIFDKATMQQVLLNGKVLKKQMTSRYCPRENVTLIALHSPGLIGCNQHQTDGSVQAKVKLNFGLFHDLAQAKSSYLSIGKGANSSTYIAGDQTVYFKDYQTYLYAVDGSTVRVDKIETINGNSDTQMSLIWRDTILSWRNESYNGSDRLFTCSYEDGSIFTMSSNEQTGLIGSISMPNDILMEFLPDGSVLIKNLAKLSSISPDSAFLNVKVHELSRIITNAGTVIKYLSNDSAETLFATGNLSSKTKNGDWISTKFDGSRILTSAAGDTTTLGPVRCIQEKLIAMGRIIVTRDDMVTITLTGEGQLISEHIDRTVITSDYGRKMPLDLESALNETPERISVESDGLPEICFRDQGQTMSISMPNGIRVTRQLHITNDTAEVLFEVDSDECKLRASSLGGVVLSQKNQTSVDYTQGYKINWLSGTFSYVDPNGTRITIDDNGKQNVEHVDCAKSASEMNETLAIKPIKDVLQTSYSNMPSNTPRLFVVNEDGSGVELLRDVDLVTYFEKVSQDGTTDIKEEPLPHEPNSTSVTIVSVHANDRNMDGDDFCKAQLVTFRQLLRHKPLTPASRESFMTEYRKYREWVREKLTPNTTFDIEDEESTTTPSTTVLFGQDKAQTQAEIYKLYQNKIEKIEQAKR
ncbi:Sperm-associated antigen 17 [Chytridiales sp. JEL 0842]|nr:Sperm-associated antigen 17 [Chytridiales sp. JEL 0842]